MKTLDICLVNATSAKDVYQTLSNEVSAIEPPIWAGLLASHLRKNNHSVDIVDCDGLMLNTQQAVNEIVSRDAKLVVFVVYGQQPSASTQCMHAASVLCYKLKLIEPSTKVLFLGGHVSALPEKTIKEEACDFVAVGEGIYTIRGLLECDLDREDELKKVPGLYFKTKAGFDKSNENAKLVSQEQMDYELPGVAYDLLPMKNYRAHNWHCFDNIASRENYASIYTSLGCPFKCSFCCINSVFQTNKFRYWSPEFMVSELEKLAIKYGVKNLKIADEMFVLRESHYLALCKLIIERGLKFNIWAYARVDTIKPKNLEIMKRAGINWLALGIESKNKHVREGVSKGQFQEESIPDIVNAVKAAGIHVIGNYIFGLPGETFSSMQETLDLAKELNCEMANFYTTMAYPGSELYRDAILRGLELPANWLGYSQHSKNCLPLSTDSLSSGEILGFRDWAWNEYFTSEKYLNMITQKFGIKTRRHLEEISNFQLKRDFITKYNG